MGEIDARTWTGGAYWHRRVQHPFSTRGWMTRYVTFPFVRLRLDAGGDQLLWIKRAEPEVEFCWPEVKEMERVKIFALPFLAKGCASPSKRCWPEASPGAFCSSRGARVGP
jgi:hypothetical protein